MAEIAPNIFRLSTFISDANFMFNQFLVVDEEPCSSTPACALCFRS
ncbi:MAG: hypothetical protein ABI775_03310 [Pseudonocardiales bacterium]